jgi:hypothetical protein
VAPDLSHGAHRRVRPVVGFSVSGVRRSRGAAIAFVATWVSWELAINLATTKSAGSRRSPCRRAGNLRERIVAGTVRALSLWAGAAAFAYTLRKISVSVGLYQPGRFSTSYSPSPTTSTTARPAPAVAAHYCALLDLASSQLTLTESIAHQPHQFRSHHPPGCRRHSAQLRASPSRRLLSRLFASGLG